jgi:hypothetical protein
MRPYVRSLLRHARAHWLDWLLGIIMLIVAGLFSSVVPFYNRKLVVEAKNVTEPDLNVRSSHSRPSTLSAHSRPHPTRPAAPRTC